MSCQFSIFDSFLASLWCIIFLHQVIHITIKISLHGHIAQANWHIGKTVRSTIAKIIEYGPIAQLGERSVRIREVEGSNPFESTIKSREIQHFTAFLQLF